MNSSAGAAPNASMTNSGNVLSRPRGESAQSGFGLASGNSSCPQARVKKFERDLSHKPALDQADQGQHSQSG
jgi:hypothetical protein